MRFNFSFGVKRKSIFDWAIITVALTSLVASLHQCTGIGEKHIWALIDEIQRTLTRKGIKVPIDVNKFAIESPELLQNRIRRDVDKAIDDYERLEREHYVPRMKNENILKEIKKSKYTDTQRRIVEDAVYYECKPDGSEAQELLGGAQGIHAAWYNSKECNY
jgi:hypothetical protein